MADIKLAANVSQLSGLTRDNHAMSDSEAERCEQRCPKHNKERREEKNITRRSFLLAGIAALLSITSTDPASAQRRVRRRPLRRPPRRARRAIRRRAIRRIRRRGNGLEDHARRAIRRGDVRPLRDVMAAVARRSNAEVLDVDLHKRPDGWIYALRILTLKGRVRDVFLDARTLEILATDKQRNSLDGIPLPTPPPGLPLPAPLP